MSMAVEPRTPIGTCIFVDRPHECFECYDVSPILCVINKRHLKLTPEGKKRALAAAKIFINSKDRYKIESGEAGRKRRRR